MCCGGRCCRIWSWLRAGRESVRGSWALWGLGRGGGVVEGRGEDGLGGVIDRESGQCGLLAGMVEQRSMMQRSCPQSLLTHDILSPFLVTKPMPQVLPEQSPICLSTTSNVNDGSNFLNFGELKKRQNFCNGLFEIYPLHCRCLVPYPGTWYLNYPGAWPLN